MKLHDWLTRVIVRLQAEDGQTMAEYGILVAVIALIAIVGATVFGGHLSTFFSGLVNDL